MNDKKVIFFGTPKYAIPVLEMLYENCNVIAVVTQPDKEVGRKKVLTPSPVKEFALFHNIKVFQPEKLKLEYKAINEMGADIYITCAYGKILPVDLIYHPKYNTVNVHGSILPKYRGGAPIERAIMNGESKTGITIMYTDKGMDSGNIIAIEELDILESDTLDSLKDKMSLLGKNLLFKTLPLIFNGSAPSIKQDETMLTLAPTIRREDEHLDFNRNAKDIYNHIRALNSEPGTFAILNDINYKIYEVRVGNVINNITGTITNIYKDGIGVASIDKEIIITKLQVPGKKIMSTKDYLNGIKKDELIGKRFI